MMYIETSARDSINVDKAIIDLTTGIYIKKLFFNIIYAELFFNS